MKASVITIIVAFGLLNVLIFVGVLKLEREIEEQEWREMMEKREEDE